MHSRGNYSSVSVCLSVTTLNVSPFVHGPKTRYHRLVYDDFLDFDSQILLKRLCSKDMTRHGYMEVVNNYNMYCKSGNFRVMKFS